MIDFACKTFKLEEVIKCGLGLTKSELKILEFLMKNKSEFKSNEISEKLSLELSTVQRALKKLHAKNIVVRSQKNLSNGYVYLYKIENKKSIKKIMLDIINNWVSRVEKEFDKW